VERLVTDQTKPPVLLLYRAGFPLHRRLLGAFHDYTSLLARIGTGWPEADKQLLYGAYENGTMFRITDIAFVVRGAEMEKSER
jgi:hypothetical protein